VSTNGTTDTRPIGPDTYVVQIVAYLAILTDCIPYPYRGGPLAPAGFVDVAPEFHDADDHALCEAVYMALQNGIDATPLFGITGAMRRHPGRSFSVGDVIIVTRGTAQDAKEVAYTVDRAGFKAIPVPPVSAVVRP
jgi:hypothetical protein